MAKIDLSPLSQIDGFIGAALGDVESGMALAKSGGGSLDLDLAVAGNSEVIKAKRKVAGALKINEGIEDILITLDKQFHLIRPLGSNANLFFYLALDRARANLAMARHELRSFEKATDFS